MRKKTRKIWITSIIIGSLLILSIGAYWAISVSRDDGNWHGPNDGGSPTVAVSVNTDFDSMQCDTVIPPDDGGGWGWGGGGGWGDGWGGSMRWNAP